MNFWREFENSELSARKLAAWLWQSQFKDVPGNNGVGFEDQLFHLSKYEPDSSIPCLKCCKEEAIKWDPVSSITHINSNNLLGGRKLRPELLHAQRYIDKLRAAPKSFMGKPEQFFPPFEEETSRKGREFQKIESVLDFLKDKLARERRRRKRMEKLNKNIILRLDEANLSGKQFMKKYEEEKRGREAMEEVCNELAKQRIEDKANLQELQKKLLEIREEAEEERIMLKMSEHWREEQVQMKLEDAKHVLEDRHNQMMQLIGNLESFLRSRGAELVIADENEAESVNITRTIVDCKQKSSVVSASEGGGGYGDWKSEGQRNSRDARNPHLTRGIIGLLEWPRVNLKNKFKAITLEAQVRKQKSRLQVMLKPNA